jgi:outer membrane lipoprotein-sorting protein
VLKSSWRRRFQHLLRTPTGTFLTCLVTLHVVVLEKKISTLIKESYRNISDMSGDFYMKLPVGVLNKC